MELDIYDYFLDFKTIKFVPWQFIVSEFKF